MRSDKLIAIKFRKLGLSYNEISRKLSIPKSTLSGWFYGLSFSQKIKSENEKKLKSILAKNITVYNKQRSLLAREKWKLIQTTAMQELIHEKISQRELLLIGTSLYWAEGYKKTNWSVVFSNSDPKMIQLMMCFFKRICSVPLEKFRVQMQIYPNISNNTAIHYWSSVTGIPPKQFTKPIRLISKESKLVRGNTLPYGTIQIRIHDVILVNKIKGWISALEKLSEKILI